MRLEKHRLNPQRGRYGEYDTALRDGGISRIGWLTDVTCYFNMHGTDDRGSPQTYRLTLSRYELGQIHRNLSMSTDEELRALIRELTDAERLALWREMSKAMKA